MEYLADSDNLTKAVTLAEAISEPLDKLIEAIKPLAKEFESFKVEERKGSNIFAFWDEYLEMLSLMRSIIQAERTGKGLCTSMPHPV